MPRTPALAAAVLGAALALSTAACTGEDDPAPVTTASPQGSKATERTAREVLEQMGATGVGVVGTPEEDEAFVYGQVGARQSVVVRTVRTSAPTAGRRLATRPVGGVEVELVRTPEFGLVARFECGRSTVDVWVRRGDQLRSQDRGAVLTQAGSYIRAAECG